MVPIPQPWTFTLFLCIFKLSPWTFTLFLCIFKLSPWTFTLFLFIFKLSPWTFTLEFNAFSVYFAATVPRLPTGTRTTVPPSAWPTKRPPPAGTPKSGARGTKPTAMSTTVSGPRATSGTRYNSSPNLPVSSNTGSSSFNPHGAHVTILCPPNVPPMPYLYAPN